MTLNFAQDKTPFFFDIYFVSYFAKKKIFWLLSTLDLHYFQRTNTFLSICFKFWEKMIGYSIMEQNRSVKLLVSNEKTGAGGGKEQSNDHEAE